MNSIFDDLLFIIIIIIYYLLAFKLATLIPQGINKRFSFNWFSSVCYVTVSADSGISMLTVSSIVSTFTIVEEENCDIVELGSTERQK